jgi:hypothetical protein
MAEKVVSAINRALLPQIQEMKGEFKALNARFDATDSKIDSFRNEFRSEIKRLDEKMDLGFKRMDEKMTSLQTQMEFSKELAVLKVKVAELEKARR